MKFIHVADIHLGARPDANYPWGGAREKEIYDTFRKVITDCNENEIDLLLIVGDLYHKQPLIRELKELNYIFQQLQKTKVVIIAGNHDYIGDRSNYRGFAWCDHVFMLEEDTLDSIYFEDINTEVYGFSYHTRDITEPRLDKVIPGVEERINILLAHGGDERNLPLDKKRLMNAGFDYVALGHIHKPEQFSDRMAYAGSLEPLDKNELGEHGYILGEIIKSEDLSANWVSDIKTSFRCICARQYIKVELLVTPEMTNGYLVDEIAKAISTHGEEHIYRIILQGKRDVDIIFDTDFFYSLGNVIEVLDDTNPNYNFMQLQKENEGNIIGAYMERITTEVSNPRLQERALYLGIEALLKARN